MAIADYTAKCEGYNSETSAPVYGECKNGEFKGVDSITGNNILGDCEIGGDFEAYDSETNAYIAGQCEGNNEDGDEGEGGNESDGSGDDGGEDEGYDENNM
jgi:hypothetical protein